MSDLIARGIQMQRDSVDRIARAFGEPAEAEPEPVEAEHEGDHQPEPERVDAEPGWPPEMLLPPSVPAPGRAPATAAVPPVSGAESLRELLIGERR